MSSGVFVYRRKKRVIPLLIVGAFFALSMWGGWKIYSIAINIPNPARIGERDIVQSTKIFDRTGTILLYEVHGEEKRTVITFEKIPKHAREATLAAEDINFYEHHGIAWRGILRAVLNNIIHLSAAQGGSTITQQLVKNSILTGEKTLTRKIKEAIISVVLEKKYSKDEILEFYLNQIPYGSNSYGIASAAQTFFAKDAENLTLAEAATIAALPKAPSYFNPYGSHRDELIKRRNWVLDRMQEAGFITQEETLAAKKTIPHFNTPQQSMRAPHFVMYVRDYLNEKYGEDFIEKGGLRVTTTLDWHMQEAAERIIKEGAEKNEKLVQSYNAALVAIDPRSGEILSMVGSRDYWSTPLPTQCIPGDNCKFDPYVNIATSPRQPGSAFKPFVYATAFKKGYSPDTILFDVLTEFNPLCNPDMTPGIMIRDPKDCYHPKNYDGKFRGPVSLKQALAQSLNVPSVKLLYLAGVEDSIATAESLGITTLTNKKNYGLSLVLGGAEVNLLEMTSAFGAFSQEGILHPKTAILRIENSSNVVLEEKKDSSLPAIDTDIARIINTILSDNDARIPVFSPRSSLYFEDRQVAVKTGTTQDFRDAWVVGYTPSIVAGVWVGNSDNTPMHQSAVSIMVAGPIWHTYLENILFSSPPEEFTTPETKPPEKPVLRGLYRTGEVIKIDTLSRKRATEFTPSELIEEVSFGEIKTILVGVQKDNPLGPPPEKPEDDTQYKNWQEGINRWLAENQLPQNEPPKDIDDIHTAEKRPKIEFVTGSDNQAIAHDIQEIVVIITSIFPLREVSFFVNDELMGSKTAPILATQLAFPIKNLLIPGGNKITITAYDAMGNKETKEKEFIVNPVISSPQKEGF